jgi:hypothetical protein
VSTSVADGGGAPCVLYQQRWEAVFRRERMPVSIDRPSKGIPVISYHSGSAAAIVTAVSVSISKEECMIYGFVKSYENKL